jgi:hypothetical protein
MSTAIVPLACVGPLLFLSKNEAVIPENPHPWQIRAMRQNQRIIRRDACDPASAHDAFAANLFKSRRQLEVENLFLRHQLTIAMRRAPRRLRLHRRQQACAGQR